MSAVMHNTKPIVDYYNSLESRIGYKLVLGDTRHFGYWPEDTYFPFPLTPRLREMENQLFKRLQLKPGAKVLDAGCGVAHVALSLAKQGLDVHAIDLVPHHVSKAKRNVARAHLPAGAGVTVSEGNYHEIDAPSGSFDGVYTMETFTHSTDPARGLSGFYRILRPGGRIAMFEYEYMTLDKALKPLALACNAGTTAAVLPGAEALEHGMLEKWLSDAGFVDVKVEDFTPNVKPLVRLFYWMALVPYYFVWLFSLERYFVNTVSGYCGYKGINEWRYVVVTGKKPEVEKRAAS